MENKRYVAFFDILAFSELVKYIPVEELRSRLETLIQKIESCTRYSEFAFNEKCKIDYVIFSDSVVFYSKDLSEESFKNICVTSISFMFFSFLDYMPVRGAISHGEFYIDKTKNIFFGKALVSAYEAEGKQKWSGAIICKETIDFVNENFKMCLEWLEKQKYIFEYDVPMEFISEERVYNDNGKAIEGYKYKFKMSRFYVLNWCFLNIILEKLDKEYKIIESDFHKYFLTPEFYRIENMNEKITYEKLYDEIKEEIRFKITNTKEFFKYSEKRK